MGIAGKKNPGRGQGYLRIEDGRSRIDNESNGTGDRTRTYDPQIHNLVL
jgi:hypothetical protein